MPSTGRQGVCTVMSGAVCLRVLLADMGYVPAYRGWGCKKDLSPSAGHNPQVGSGATHRLTCQPDSGRVPTCQPDILAVLGPLTGGPDAASRF